MTIMKAGQIHQFSAMMNEHKNQDIGFTEFDYQMITPQLQMIKAAIPYLPVRQQKFVAFYIRLQEAKRTAELFREGDLSAAGLSPDPGNPVSPFEMLQAMKPFAGPRERDTIEMLENIQLMMQTMQSPT